MGRGPSGCGHAPRSAARAAESGTAGAGQRSPCAEPRPHSPFSPNLFSPSQRAACGPPRPSPTPPLRPPAPRRGRLFPGAGRGRAGPLGWSRVSPPALRSLTSAWGPSAAAVGLFAGGSVGSGEIGPENKVGGGRDRSVNPGKASGAEPVPNSPELRRVRSGCCSAAKGSESEFKPGPGRSRAVVLGFSGLVCKGGALKCLRVTGVRASTQH